MGPTNEPIDDPNDIVAEPAEPTRGQNIRAVLSDGKSKKVIAAVIGIFALVVIAGVVMMTKRPKAVVPDDMRGASVSAPPAGAGASTPTPFYRQALQDTESRLADEAEQKGASHIKTPLDRPGDIPPNRQPQEPSQPRLYATAPVSPQQNQALYARASQQLASLADQWAPGKPQVVTYKYEDDVKGNGNASSTTQSGIRPGPSEQGGPGKVLVRAGQKYTITLDHGINTDLKTGKVIATVRSGPYENEKVLGSVKREGEKATLGFDTMSLPDGPSIKIEAYAVDVDTTLPGLATEVDNHYFERYVVGGAMRLIEGLGQAAARGSTSISVNVNGGYTSQQDALSPAGQAKMAIGHMAGELAKDMRAAQPKEPTVKVSVQTPAFLVFTKDVVQQPSR